MSRSQKTANIRSAADESGSASTRPSILIDRIPTHPYKLASANRVIKGARMRPVSNDGSTNSTHGTGDRVESGSIGRRPSISLSNVRSSTREDHKGELKNALSRARLGLSEQDQRISVLESRVVALESELAELHASISWRSVQTLSRSARRSWDARDRIRSKTAAENRRGCEETRRQHEIRSNPPIFPRFDRPHVTIVIPAYNHYYGIYWCLKSIERETTGLYGLDRRSNPLIKIRVAN